MFYSNCNIFSNIVQNFPPEPPPTQLCIWWFIEIFPLILQCRNCYETVCTIKPGYKGIVFTF